jgi:hypothetical protein
LDEFEKQKYTKDKMATEGHLSTLCNLLWGEKVQFGNSVTDMFAFGIISSMFGYNGLLGGNTSSTDYLKKALDDEKEKLVEEYKVTLESLVEKTKFVYSEEFYKLDEVEKQKYTKDKMTTEAHLSTLCELLWGKNVQFDNSIGNMFALGIISSMLGSGGWGGSSPSVDYLKNTLNDDEKEKQDEVYAIPTNENKAE